MSSSGGSDDADADQEVWDDWGDGGEDSDPVQSLFCTRVFPTAEDALDFDAKEHSFDLRLYRQQERLDDLETIRVINYVRQEVAKGNKPAGTLTAGARPWDEDKYLQPVLLDDGLLQYDFEDLAGPSTSQEGTDMEVQQLREENAVLKAMLLEQRVAPPSSKSPAIPKYYKHVMTRNPHAVQEPQASDPADSIFATAAARPDDDIPSTSAAGPAPDSCGSRRGDRAAAARRAAIAKVDGHYFDSYGDFGIHRTMLRDKVRTEAYRRAMQANRAGIAGKCVLDVGCGTGILSLFAAEAGAAQVIGVEGSASMAETARAICRENGEAGRCVTIVPGQLETLDSLPTDQVDVIASEWMGYALLFESMLDSVLHARDRWLRPGGTILPDRVTLHLAAASEAALDLEFWDDVYGFSMCPIRDSIRSKLRGVVEVLPVRPADVITDTAQIHAMDLTTMQPGDAYCRADFTLAARCQAPSSCHAFILWFDAHFTARFGAAASTVLSTSPLEPQTHWHQASIMLREPVPLGQGGNDVLAKLQGTITLARGRSHRGLDVVMEYLGPKAQQIVVHASLE